jgi:hypothetical protein
VLAPAPDVPSQWALRLGPVLDLVLVVLLLLHAVVDRDTGGGPLSLLNDTVCRPATVVHDTVYGASRVSGVLAPWAVQRLHALALLVRFASTQ